MGTIEFRVNGDKVGEIYFRNLTGGDVSDYTYEYFVPEEGVINGKVCHRRSNGIETLAYLILSDMRG